MVFFKITLKISTLLFILRLHTEESHMALRGLKLFNNNDRKAKNDIESHENDRSVPCREVTLNTQYIEAVEKVADL